MLALLTALSTAALANGGPVAWTEGTGLGGLAPAETTPVQLQGERLRITLAEDLRSYTAHATYRLHNPGPPTTVRYGVPLVAHAEFAEETDLEALSRRLRLRLDEESVAGGAISCGPASQGLDLPGDSEVRLVGWCTTTLALPAGDATLELTIEGDLHYSDWESSKSALARLGPRTLLWPLSPAGAWAGGPAQVEISVKLGPFAGLATVKGPPGAVIEEDTVRWPAARLDLDSAPPLELSLDAEALGLHRQVATMNARGGQQITASSTLPAQAGIPYDAGQANDGNAGTAWCEGVDGQGVGQVLTLRTSRSGPDYCHIEGLAIIPGYARNDATWTQNGRVQAITVRPCGGEGQRLELEVDARFDRSGRMIPLDSDAACHEVVIEAVLPGSKHPDTCISELRVVENCG